MITLLCVYLLATKILSSVTSRIQKGRNYSEVEIWCSMRFKILKKIEKTTQLKSVRALDLYAISSPLRGVIDREEEQDDREPKAELLGTDEDDDGPQGAQHGEEPRECCHQSNIVHPNFD